MRNKIKQVVETWRAKHYFIPQRILCGPKVWKLLTSESEALKELISEYKYFNDIVAGEDIEFHLESLVSDYDIVGVSVDNQTKVHRFEILATKHKCHCPAHIVFNIGCKCGGI